MIAQASASPRSAARLVFTAHSIPVAMAGAARYRAQLLDSSRLVADRLGIADGALAFQSSGRPENPCSNRTSANTWGRSGLQPPRGGDLSDRVRFAITWKCCTT